MTNGELYKTAEERSYNFGRFCVIRSCGKCPCYDPTQHGYITSKDDAKKYKRCEFVWLELDSDAEYPGIFYKT